MVFILVGLLMLRGAVWVGYPFYNLQKQTIQKYWRSADAEVVKSEVTTHPAGGRQFIGGVTYVHCRLDIEFRYTVEEKEYLRTTYDPEPSSCKEAKRALENYKPGAHRRIHYNLSDPGDIRLDRGFNFIFFIVPVVVGGLGLLASWSGIRALFASGSVTP